MRAIIAAAAAGLCAGAALAQSAGFTEERRALFVSIVEENGCVMNNFAPNEGIVTGLQESGFTRDEVRAIGTDLLETGDGVREGENLVIKSEACS